jgi:hypothetical protein
MLKKPMEQIFVELDTLIIIKKKLRNKKVTTLQCKGVQELKKNKPPNTTQSNSQTPKEYHSCMFLYHLVEFKDDL